MLLDHAVNGEPRDCAGASRGAHATALFGIGDEPLDRGSQRGAIADRHDQTGHFVLDERSR
jgi:hypothetical protein